MYTKDSQPVENAFDGDLNTFSYTDTKQGAKSSWFKIVYKEWHYIRHVKIKRNFYNQANNLYLRIGFDVENPINNKICTHLDINNEEFNTYSCDDGIRKGRVLYFSRYKKSIQLYEVQVLALRL